MPRVSKKDQNLENKFPKTDRFELSQESVAVDEELLNRLVAPTTSCAIGGDKTAQQFLQDNYNDFRESLGLYTLLITGIITPDECNEGESWDLIIHRRDKLIDLLKTNYPDILFIVSGIEEHVGSHKISSKKSEDKDKSKGKSEDNEEENSDLENPLPVDLKPVKTKKSNKADIPTEETPIGKNYVWNVPVEARKSQVISCFSEHNEKLELSLASTENQVLLRILNYGKTACLYPTPNRCEKYFVKTEELKSSDIEPEIYNEIYENLFSTYGPKKETKAKRKDLKGYAHLHMVLFLTTKSGKPINIVQVNNLCRSNNIFVDVTTKEDLNLSYENLKKKKSVITKGNPLSYVLKNNRHRGSYVKLGYKNPCELHIIKENSKVTNFFSNLINTTGSKVILNGVDKTVKAPLEKFKPLESKQKVLGKKSEEIDPDVPLALDKQEIMISFVNEYLKENDLAFGPSNKIYKRLAGARNTYKLHRIEIADGISCDCDYKTLLAEMTNTNRGRKIFPASKSEYLFYAEMPNQRVFTRVCLNHEWVEFKDFFVHIPSKTVYTGEPEWACYTFLNHSYSDLLSLMKLKEFLEVSNDPIPTTNFETLTPEQKEVIIKEVKERKVAEVSADLKSSLPKNWLFLLENSGYIDSNGKPIKKLGKGLVKLYCPKYQTYKDAEKSYLIEGQTLIDDLFNLLTPKIHKGKVPVLHGAPNCGKTTVATPFIGILPIQKVGTCSKSSGFEMENFDGKQLVVLDEFSLARSGLNRSDLLQVMEGNALMNINPKGKTPYTTKINTNMIVINNKNNWATRANGSTYDYEIVPEAFVEVDTAYSARCNFYPFEDIPEKQRKSGVKEIIEYQEKGLIFLYLMLFSTDSDFKRLNFVHNLEEMRTKNERYYELRQLGMVY